MTRHFAMLSVGCWLAAALACQADGLFLHGYLPAVGPATLRFRSSSSAKITFLPLPPASAKADSAPAPPISEQAEPENPFALTESLTPAADTNATIMEAISPPPAPVIVAPTPVTVPVPETTASDAPITPRMFLPYFNSVSTTNAPKASGGASVNFTPPHAVEPAATAPKPAAPSPSAQ